MRGTAGTGRGDAWMVGGRQGHGAGNGDGMRGCRLPTPPCFFLRIYLCISAFGLDKGGGKKICVLFAHVKFISFYSFCCKTHISCLIFNVLDVIIGRHAWVLLLSPYMERVAAEIRIHTHMKIQ